MQDFLNLNFETLQFEVIANENAATDGDSTGQMKSQVSPQGNGGTLPKGIPSDSELSHNLPSKQDVILSVSHLSASWSDVSQSTELEQSCEPKRMQDFDLAVFCKYRCEMI